MADEIKILQEIANQIREGNRERQNDNLDTNIALEDIAKGIDGSNSAMSTLSDKFYKGLNSLASSVNGMVQPVEDVQKVEVVNQPEPQEAPDVIIPDQEEIQKVEVMNPEDLKGETEIEVPEVEVPDIVPEEDTVQKDPNITPTWVERMFGQNKEYYSKSLELTGVLGDKISGLGNKIAKGLSNLPGVDAAKSFFGAISDLAKKVFIVIGAFTALQGFLNGLEKASKWFGDEANFKQLFASGLAGIAEAFGLVTEEEAKAIAENIVSVFEWIEETAIWMFDGVKKFGIGIKDFIKKLDGIGKQFESGDILGGLSSLWGNIKEDLFGNLNMGVVAAFALIKPDWAFSAVKGILKLSKGALGLIGKGINGMLTDQADLVAEKGPGLVSKIGTKLTGMLSSAGASAKEMASKMASGLSSLGSQIASTASSFAKGAVSTVTKMGASMMSGLASLGSSIAAAASSFMAAATSLLVTVAPFIAAAAAIALAIKGIYEGFQEGMAIFEETGSVVEGLKAGISKLFGTIIGFVPDLIKDIVSWAARSLGFETFADDLDSFSFTDAITDAFRGVMNWFEKFPLMLKKGIYSLLNKIPGFRGDFDEDIAALDQQMAEKDQQAAETTRIIEEKRAAEAEAEKLEKQKEDVEAEKLEGSETPEVVPLEAPTQVVNQTMTIDNKPITEGLKRIEDAINRYFEALDVEMQNNKGGGVAVSNVNNQKTINQSTVAVSTQLSHKNIGATRGMFGAPLMPLSNPNAA